MLIMICLWFADNVSCDTVAVYKGRRQLHKLNLKLNTHTSYQSTHHFYHTLLLKLLSFCQSRSKWSGSECILVRVLLCQFSNVGPFTFVLCQCVHSGVIVIIYFVLINFFGTRYALVSLSVKLVSCWLFCLHTNWLQAKLILSDFSGP